MNADKLLMKAHHRHGSVSPALCLYTQDIKV